MMRFFRRTRWFFWLVFRIDIPGMDRIGIGVAWDMAGDLAEYGRQ